jgi:hypothetical protein
MVVDYADDRDAATSRGLVAAGAMNPPPKKGVLYFIGK